MKKSFILLVIVSLMPSYFALLSHYIGSIFIILLTTFFGIVFTGMNNDDDIVTKEQLKLSWILHLLGVCVVAYVKSQL